MIVQFSETQALEMVDDAIKLAAYFNSLKHGRAMYNGDGRCITPTSEEAEIASKRLLKHLLAESLGKIASHTIVG